MEDYITIIFYKSIYLSIRNLNKYDCREISDRFEKWKKSSNKSYNEFQNPLFCDIYTKEMFPNRCRMFHQLLQDLCRDCMEAKDVIYQVRNIYSFGCGPGPEIVAILIFIRDTMNRNDNYINVTAVDKISYWNNYIQLIGREILNCNVNFQAYTLSRATIGRVRDNQDVCIFSYSDVLTLIDIIPEIQRKFKLVLVIDQDWNGSSNRLEELGFQNTNFLFNGHWKRCYSYYYKLARLPPKYEYSLIISNAKAPEITDIIISNQFDDNKPARLPPKYEYSLSIPNAKALEMTDIIIPVQLDDNKPAKLPHYKEEAVTISIGNEPDFKTISNKSNSDRCCGCKRFFIFIRCVIFIILLLLGIFILWHHFKQ